MNAGISEIDGQEQEAARLNEIVEELPIVEPRQGNEIVLPESNSIVSQYSIFSQKRKTK
jgi:hypothetical protein